MNRFREIALPRRIYDHTALLVTIENTGFQIKFGMTEKKEMNGSNPSTIRHAHCRQAHDRWDCRIRRANLQ